MQLVVYDETFAGFLTAVFEIYEYKYADAKIIKQSCYNKTVFQQEHIVHTNIEKAKRVWKGLLTYESQQCATELYHVWLSDINNIEETLLQYLQCVFTKKQSVQTDYSHAAVLMVSQVARKMHREKHRMEAFIRFQLTKDNLYYAVVEPDYNVLPLLINHFKNRYADQRWLIYDGKRRYGIYYNLETVETITLSFSEETSSNQIQMVYDEKEPLYQSLWQNYFSSVNIKARKNTKLHIQHMPKRYWKYLTEKQVFQLSIQSNNCFDSN